MSRSYKKDLIIKNLYNKLEPIADILTKTKIETYILTTSIEDVILINTRLPIKKKTKTRTRHQSHKYLTLVLDNNGYISVKYK